MKSLFYLKSKLMNHSISGSGVYLLSSSHQSQTLQSYSVRSTFRIMYRDGVWFRDSPFIPYILIGDSPPHVSSYPGPCCELNRILNKKKMKLLNIRNFAKRSQTYQRSEEHTSELQSPVPISYAVFCLKKKIPNFYVCCLITN